MDNEKPRKAVFLDRDGTLIEEVNFLSKVDDLHVFPYTFEAVKLLKDAGFLVFVVTNQSGIGRGIFDADAMHAIHEELQSHLDGMIESAAADFPIEFEGSWMIGDKKIDVETGRNAGVRSAMVMTGYGRSHVGRLDIAPDVIAEDLLEAVRAMLR